MIEEKSEQEIVETSTTVAKQQEDEFHCSELVLPEASGQDLERVSGYDNQQPPIIPRERGDSQSRLDEFEEAVDYSNGWVLTILGYLIWLIVVAANVYVLTELALGAAT